LIADGRASRGIDAEARAILDRHNAEKRDMGVATGSLGGYFVPQGYRYEIEQAMKWYGGMLEATDSIDTSTGQALPWPTDNDTANTGERIGENQQVTTGDVTVGSLTFNAWKYSTKLIKVSVELLQDSAFNIEDFLKTKFAIRFGRVLNTDFTLGSGSSQPMGLVTAIVANNGTAHTWGSSSGPGVPLIAGGSSANTGGSEDGTASIGSLDLVNLEHSLDKAYRRGASYMMSDLTLRYIKNLLDKYGRPLWLPGLAVNAPDTINGYPYFTNNDMATLATGNKTVIFGNLKKYMRRNVKELAILRLTERFADYGQVGFLGFGRYDGNLLDAGTHPVNYLKQA
jgi:HK97 family phage major capsid protein